MKTCYYFIFLVAGLLLSQNTFAQTFFTDKGETSFFSETPVENISAVNRAVSSLLNTATREIVVKMTITKFDFPNKLMQEHFNENYLESGKYPDAVFKGKISENVDFEKEGTYPVTATGTFTLHGISKPRTLIGTLTFRNHELILLCDFKVALTDYNIEVPRLVLMKVAETIAVRNKFVYTPYLRK